MWARADTKKDLYNLHVTQATETLIKVHSNSPRTHAPRTAPHYACRVMHRT
jgi:hypothetical protein